jgi:predicted transposase YbfD/YdcC
MTETKTSDECSILSEFGDMPDPRVERTKLHSVLDIMAIVLCGALCGVDNFVQIELWAVSNEAWLRTFLKLPNGIPSHDTMGRVFSLLDPEEFQRRFVRWVQAVTKAIEGVVAIDGKTLRRSGDKASGKKALHMVSAWSATNRMVLGQISTDEKSNEITAIPKLLECLSIHGCIVTIDAMGTQKEIAAAIVEKGAHYILALKENQALFAKDVTSYFEWVFDPKFNHPQPLFHETVDKNGGRIETRRIWLSNTAPLIQRYGEDWSGLTSIAKVESIREIDGQKSIEHRCYISSLPGDDVKAFGEAIRSHWGVENQLHWALDVVFDEDQCRVRKDNAAENLAVVRHIALSLHNKHGNVVEVNGRKRKTGLANRRQLASWNKPYLENLLSLLSPSP